jgi:hypothetical protein
LAVTELDELLVLQTNLVMLQFAVHVPLVLFLVWILNYTLTYVPPTL